MFGLSTSQAKEAGSILQEMAQDWRGLVAGAEGFLTDKDHRGLYRQAVVWGEMVRWDLRIQKVEILGTQQLMHASIDPLG
jgi:hypothetical protein